MLAINVSALQESLASSVDKVVESNEIIKICTNKGNAIIISEEDYNALLETLALQSDSSVIKKIKDGEKENVSTMNSYYLNEKW